MLLPSVAARFRIFSTPAWVSNSIPPACPKAGTVLTEASIGLLLALTSTTSTTPLPSFLLRYSA